MYRLKFLKRHRGEKEKVDKELDEYSFFNFFEWIRDFSILIGFCLGAFTIFCLALILGMVIAITMHKFSAWLMSALFL